MPLCAPAGEGGLWILSERWLVPLRRAPPQRVLRLVPGGDANITYANLAKEVRQRNLWLNERVSRYIGVKIISRSLPVLSKGGP